MKSTISPSRVYLLRYLFEDPTIRNIFTIENETLKYVVINSSTGTVELCRSRIPFLNRIIGGRKTYDLSTVLLKVTKVLTGTNNYVSNKEAWSYMVKEVVDAAIAQEDFDKAIDVVVGSIMFGLEGPLHSKFITEFEPVKDNSRTVRTVCEREIAGLGIGNVLLPSGETIKVPISVMLK